MKKGGLFDFIPFDSNALNDPNFVPSFDPTDEDRKAARRAALLNAGIAMMANANKGNNAALSAGLGGGLMAYTQGMQAPQARFEQAKSLLDFTGKQLGNQKTAAELKKYGREEADYNKQQSFYDTLTNPGLASMAGGGGPSVTNLNTAQNFQANPAAMFADPRINAQAIAAGVDPKRLGDALSNTRPFAMDSGKLYVNPMTGQREYVPQLDKNMTLDAQGRAMAVPGAMEGLNSLRYGEKSGELAAQLNYDRARLPYDVQRAGGIANVEASARANYDPYTYTDERGNPQQTTRGAYVNGVTGGNYRVSPQEQARRDALAQKVYDQEGAGTFSPRLNDRPGAGLNNQVANLGIPAIRGQNPARSKENTDMASYLVNDYYKPIMAEAQKASGRASQTEYLLSKLDKGELKVSALAPFATEVRRYLVGAGLATEEQANKLQASELLRKFGPEMVMSGPRLEGPQSNKDLDMYLGMYANEKDSQRGFDLSLSMMRAQDMRRKEKASFVNAYRNANGSLDGAEETWQNGPGNRSLFEEKRLMKFLPTTDVKSGPMKGKKVAMLPDGRVIEVK